MQDGTLKLRPFIDVNEMPSKNCDERQRGRGMQQGKLNAPTFAYRTVHGDDPPEFLRGRTDSPKKKWKGLYVDAGLKDEWLERLNNLPIDIRSTEEGKSDLRPAFVMFRMHLQLDTLHGDMTDQLNRYPDIQANTNIGQGGRPRICVANRITKDDPEWENWWDELPTKIESAYETTLEQNGLQFTFDNTADLEKKYRELANKQNASCNALKKDADILGKRDIADEFGCQ